MKLPENVLVAVGSSRHEICSIGAFARAEASALEKNFKKVEILEPNQRGQYPHSQISIIPEVVFFHAPALTDRKYPWNVFRSFFSLKKMFPKACFIPIIHEFSEAPLHWKGRQLLILKMSNAAIVNTLADFIALQPWHKKILRSHLAPTLFWPELLNLSSLDEMKIFYEALRATLSSQHPLLEKEKWILYPGLLTQDKGLELLLRISRFLNKKIKLILMGAVGPKQKDKKYAKHIVSELQKVLGDSIYFLEAPSDTLFKQFLFAADLVVLPYNNGVSERRSSFLSAMSCGANGWTTIGTLSSPLCLDQTGVYSVNKEATDSVVFESIQQALNENPQEVFLKKQKNLNWATQKSWENRVHDIKKFLLNL